MDKEYALSVIRQYADECMLEEPRKGMRRETFKRYSYERWAVDELITYIQESSGMPSIMAVETFIRKVIFFSRRKDRNREVFLTARDVALDILDLLLAMGDEYSGWLV